MRSAFWMKNEELNPGVHGVRAYREPDEVQVFEWFTRGKDMKHAQRGINAHDHDEIVRLA
jgi:hypothetical protein